MTLVAVAFLVAGALLIVSAWENQSILATVRSILSGQYVPTVKKQSASFGIL